MKFGISTACFYPMNTEEALEFLGKKKVPITEIFINSHCELDEEFTDLLNSIRLKYGIEINSIHACGSLGEPYFLFSEYERRYNETREFYKKYYAAAQKLGAKMVILHGDSLRGHVSLEEYSKRLSEMNEDAARFGVVVSHENVNRFRMAVPENVKALKAINKEQTFTFDIKQTIRAGVDAYEMLETMGDKIVNVHISDNTIYKDCLLPGCGSFDFGTFFKKLEDMNYDGACLIEVYRHSYNEYNDLIDAYKFVNNLTK